MRQPSYFDSIQFQGLILDPGAITIAPAIAPQLIEFIGDSITSGYLDSRAELSDYAWLAGEQLHVEHTQIAYPGICLVDNVACYSPNSIGMGRQFFKLQTPNSTASPNWDFTRYQAQEVVINLGTNDSNVGISDATFQSAYVSFLREYALFIPMHRFLCLEPLVAINRA